MTIRWRYVVPLVAAIGLIAAINLSRPRPLNWNESFEAAEKIPYGCFALRELLPDIMRGSVRDASDPIEEVFTEGESAPKNYIFVNTAVLLGGADLDTLLRFVDNGGNVFIAAYVFGRLEDSLGITTEYDRVDEADSVAYDLVNPTLDSISPVRFTHLAATGYISRADTTTTTVLGTDATGEANFIRVDRGKGSFYLSTLPAAFGNYNVVDARRGRYAFGALSYLPSGETIWDEYYKGRRASQSDASYEYERPRSRSDEPGKSIFGYILGDEALSWAFYLGLAGVILFMVFMSRRRQRVIPVVAPPRNTTLEFTGTVGMLYYHHGDHRNIARKKAGYFLEQLRSIYGLKTATLGAELAEPLSKRSGVPLADVERLLGHLARVDMKQEYDEQNLLELNAALEEFERRSVRGGVRVEG